MQMTRSHRFARFLGSRRLLQIKIVGKESVRDVLQERRFFEQQFVLCGRVFVPFSTKDAKVYLMEIDADHDGRKPLCSQGDQYRQSLADCVAWHNPMELNSSQASLQLMCLRYTEYSSAHHEMGNSIRPRVVNKCSCSAV